MRGSAKRARGNLDTRTGELILDLLRDLNRERGLTIVLVTHSALAASSGKRTLEFRDGRVVRDVRVPLEERPVQLAARR